MDADHEKDSHRRIGARISDDHWRMWRRLLKRNKRLQGADIEYMIERAYEQEFPGEPIPPAAEGEGQ